MARQAAISGATIAARPVWCSDRFFGSSSERLPVPDRDTYADVHEQTVDRGGKVL